MVDTCILCKEPILPEEDEYDHGRAHRECALRMVTGGIGHLTNHAFWCKGVGNDPDAGFTYRESSVMVAGWVADFGVTAAIQVDC